MCGGEEIVVSKRIGAANVRVVYSYGKTNSFRPTYVPELESVVLLLVSGMPWLLLHTG